MTLLINVNYPSVPTPAPAVPRSLGYSRLAAPEKKMVKLAPLRMAASHTFDRSAITFMTKLSF